MPSIHPDGTFTWFDLTTTDLAAAKKFYGELLGWHLHEDTMPGGMVYVHARLPLGGDGKPEWGEVAGMGAMPDEMKGMGIPSHWTPCVQVPNCAAMLEKAKGLGAEVLYGPMEIPGADGAVVGVYGGFKDPQGAVCALWQPGTHAGSDFDDGRAGTACWTELSSTHVAGSVAFYTALFGWATRESKMGADNEVYTEVKTAGDKWVGGMMASKAPADVPSFWLNYFSVPNVDEAVRKAQTLGAKPMFEPMDIPGVGRIAGLFDPTGAAFAVWTKG